MLRKATVTNVDDDGQYEVAIYNKDGEKEYETKVDEFLTELYSNQKQHLGQRQKVKKEKTD